MSEIIDRLEELASGLDPDLKEITVTRDEALDLLDVLNHQPGAAERG